MRWRGPWYLPCIRDLPGASVSPATARLRATLGSRLGWVVKASGKSHAELAAALGMHQTTLSACIRGERFSVERIADILEQLGYPVAFEPVEGEEDVRKMRQKRGTQVRAPKADERVFIQTGPSGSMGVKER